MCHFASGATANKSYIFVTPSCRGRAGCGKTILLNAIGAQARLDGYLTAPAASTGLAALNQKHGLTFHKTFEVCMHLAKFATITYDKFKVRFSRVQVGFVWVQRYNKPTKGMGMGTDVVINLPNN